jgi:hypothetical protein
MIEGPGYFTEKVREPWNFRRKTKDAKAGMLIQAGYSSCLKDIPSAWDYCNYVMVVQNPSNKTLAFWIRNRHIPIGYEAVLKLRNPKTYDFKNGEQWEKDTEKVIIETIGKKPEEINIRDSSKVPKPLLTPDFSVAKVIAELSKDSTYFMGAEFFRAEKKYKPFEISSLNNPSFPPLAIFTDLFRIGSVELTIEEDRMRAKALDDLGQYYITLMADID